MSHAKISLLSSLFEARITIKTILIRYLKWSPLPDLNCSLVVDDLRQLLHEVAKNAKLELMRGNDQAVNEFLEALIEPELDVVLNE